MVATSMTPVGITRPLVCVLACCIAASHGWIWTFGEARSSAVAAPPTKSDGSGDAVKVEVVVPRKGGLARTTIQPGSVHAFEEAELYSQTYGYRKELKVA